MSKVPTKGRSLGVKGKLIALLVGTAFVALLMACFAFAYYDRTSYTAARQQTLGVLVESVAQSAFGPAAFQDPDSSQVILKVLEAEPMAIGGAIYLKDGTQLTAWQRAGAGFELPKTGPNFTPPEGSWFIQREIKNPEQSVGHLSVVFETKDVAARTRKFIQIAGGVLALAALAAFVLAALAQRVFTRPVRSLSDAANRVQMQKDFDTRAVKMSDDELGALTDAFNSMLAMIQARDRELESHRVHLEDLVAERTRDLNVRNEEMRLVLDNVDQGFVTLGRDGTIGAERSQTFNRWFPAAVQESAFGKILGSRIEGFAEHFAMYFDEVLSGFLPLELTLAQLPAYLETEDGRHFHVGYTPIGRNGDDFQRLLVVLSDITERVNRERSEAEQAQIMAVFEHVSRDRGGFVEFYNEAEALLMRVTSDNPGERPAVLRDLHTLKGNAGLFGLKPLATLIHRVESDCIDTGELPTPEHRTELQNAWRRFSERVQVFLGEQARMVAMELHEYLAIKDLISGGASSHTILEAFERMQAEPVQPKLERLGSRAITLAERLHKGVLTLEIDAKGVRSTTELGWLWQVLPHVIANAVDHGLAPESESKRAPKLTLTAKESPGVITIEVADNGKGIDWKRVRKKAEAEGLPFESQADLVSALFADGLSTLDAASEVSGRGVGLAAVKAACATHGADVVVTSEIGAGTRFIFKIPVPRSTREVTQLALARNGQQWSVPPSQNASIRPRVSLTPGPN